MITNSSGVAAACVLCETKRMHLSYIYVFYLKMTNQPLQCFQTEAVRFKMRSVLRVRIAPREE